MPPGKPDRSAATISSNRAGPAPSSGMCVTCRDGSEGPCEIGHAALKGRDTACTQPCGILTTGAGKDHAVDFSHFKIRGTCAGAAGKAVHEQIAALTAVDCSTSLGADGGIKVDFPVLAGAADAAGINWEEVAAGAAVSGVVVVAGGNICGMDPDAEFKNGRVLRSPEMKRRVDAFKRWYDGKGGLIVQATAEDSRLGVPEYVIDSLGVEIVELKWEQVAGSIRREAQVPDLDRAMRLKERGYIVLPDPGSPASREAFKHGGITEFERHSRLGMVDEEGFHREVERLRKIGAKHVALNTGCCRPADLARAIKFSSNAKIDLLTIDGGGTGMGPGQMMHGRVVPTVRLESMAYEMCKRLRARGAYVAPIAVAGGKLLEDHIFKVLALGAPYVKAVCLGRSILAASMAGKTRGRFMAGMVKQRGRGATEGCRKLLGARSALMERFGNDFADLPAGAIGMYSCIERLRQGLRRCMAGVRKLALEHIARNDLVALTPEASEVSGIPCVMDCDREEIARILG